MDLTRSERRHSAGWTNRVRRKPPATRMTNATSLCRRFTRPRRAQAVLTPSTWMGSKTGPHTCPSCPVFYSGISIRPIRTALPMLPSPRIANAGRWSCFRPVTARRARFTPDSLPTSRAEGLSCWRSIIRTKREWRSLWTAGTVIRRLPNDLDLIGYMTAQQAIRVADIRFALDRVSQMPLGTHLDIDHAAAIGHSFGGASSLAAWIRTSAFRLR